MIYILFILWMETRIDIGNCIMSVDGTPQQENKGMAQARTVAEEKFARRAKAKAARETKGMMKAKAVAEAKAERKAVAAAKARAIAEAKAEQQSYVEAQAQVFAEEKAQIAAAKELVCQKRAEIKMMDKAIAEFIAHLERRQRSQSPIILELHRVRACVKTQRRRAREKGNSGSFTAQQIIEMREAQNYQCAYCQRATKLTIKGAKLLEEWVNRWYERDR
jgi:hypothetical protein